MSGPSDLKVTFNQVSPHPGIPHETTKPLPTPVQNNAEEAHAPKVKELQASGPTQSNISILKQLENQLIIEYSKAMGNAVDPLGLSEGGREACMKKILPCIKKFHGKFDRKDPNKADSPIILSTYYPFPKRDPKTNQPIIDPENGLPLRDTFFKCIKVKMTWQFEVNFNGSPKTLQYSQFLETPSLLPNDPGNFEQVDVAKIKGMLSAKVIRQLLKKAFFFDTYKLITHDNCTESIDKKVFLKYMHISPVFHLTHNPGANGGRFWRSPETSIQKGELPCYTEVDLNGRSMYLFHAPDKNVKGRKLVYYDKDHKELPVEKKSLAVYSKYLKVYVPTNPKHLHKNANDIDEDGTAYDIHVYQQGSLATIDDPEMNALEALSKSESPNILQELDKKKSEIEKLTKLAISMSNYSFSLSMLDKAKYRDYEKAKYYQSQKKFKQEEEHFRKNLLKSIQDGAYGQGFFAGLFIEMTLDMQEFFSPGSAISKLLEQQVENLDKQIADLKQAELAKDRNEKARLLKDLENSYKQMTQFREFTNKFEESVQSMKLARDHISQVGVLNDQENDEFRTKVFLSKSEKNIQDAEEKLGIYASLQGAGPQIKVIESILKANNKL